MWVVAAESAADISGAVFATIFTLFVLVLIWGFVAVVMHRGVLAATLFFTDTILYGVFVVAMVFFKIIP